MAFFTIPGIRLRGIAAAVPDRCEHNGDLALIDERERGVLMSTIGISARRVAPAGVCASDLCASAAQRLLRDAGCPGDSIGILVFVTQTPDFALPGNSMLVQKWLGLPSTTLLLDLNQGCAGYVYGLSVIAGLMHAAGIAKGLLLVGDTITRILSPSDRSTVPLFSDAGSATLLERSESAAAMHFHLGADGNGACAIRVRNGGARNPFDAESLVQKEEGPGIRRAPVHLVLEGVDVLHYSLKNVVPNVNDLLASSRTDAGSVDYFVFHQANRILNEGLRKKLGIPPEKSPETLSVFGNTSSATIPLTVSHRLGKRLSDAPARLLFCGFGVGFSWGSALIDTDNVVCPDLVTLEDGVGS
jgi:3-oxoacyl-[acyl-carrier-protein] synthase III